MAMLYRVPITKRSTRSSCSLRMVLRSVSLRYWSDSVVSDHIRALHVTRPTSPAKRVSALRVHPATTTTEDPSPHTRFLSTLHPISRLTPPHPSQCAASTYHGSGKGAVVRVPASATALHSSICKPHALALLSRPTTAMVLLQVLAVSLELSLPDGLADFIRASAVSDTARGLGCLLFAVDV